MNNIDRLLHNEESRAQMLEQLHQCKRASMVFTDNEGNTRCVWFNMRNGDMTFALYVMYNETYNALDEEGE